MSKSQTYSIGMTLDSLMCRDLVMAMVNLASQGITSRLVDDAEIVLDTVRRMRPQYEEIDLLYASIAAKRKDMHLAISLLTPISEKPSPLSSSAKSLLAYCQMAIGDLTWKHTAEEAWDMGGDADDLAMAAMLLGKTDSEVEMHAGAPARMAAEMSTPMVQYARA